MQFYAHTFFETFIAWDCSAWVRTYALFLEERLECFRILRYDIEAERIVRSPQKTSKVRASRLINFENYHIFTALIL